MKTSNKIILAFFLFQIAGVVAAMVTIKKNLTIKTTETIVGNAVMKKVVLADTLISNRFKVGGNSVFKIDPNSTSVIVEFDENLLESFELEDTEEYFDFRQKHDTHLSYKGDPVFTVGVKGKQNLKFQVYHSGKLESLGPVTLSSLLIESGDSADINLEMNTKVITLFSDDEAKINVKGKTDVITLELEDDVNLNLNALEIGLLNVQMENHSDVQVDNCDVATGFMRDHSKITFNSDLPAGLIDLKGDAQKVVTSINN